MPENQNSENSKKQHILNIIQSIREFQFCGPSDDPDEKTAVCVGYHYLVTQLKLSASPYLPKNLSVPLSEIKISLDDLSSVYEASPIIDTLLPDIEKTIKGIGDT